MKIFEFHFNPKAEPDSFFRAFNYDPPEKEKRIPAQGSFFAAGELSHALSRNANLLERIAKQASGEYFAKPPKAKQPEQLMKETVRKTNEFLTQEMKKGNVDWLGNLHLVLASCTATGASSYFFQCAKSGSVKILLLRGRTITDLGKSIDEKPSNANPAAVFGNLISGKVFPGDRIAVLSRDLHAVFEKERVIPALAEFAEQKQFAAFFKQKEKPLAEHAGILVVLVLEQPRYAQLSPVSMPSRRKTIRQSIQAEWAKGLRAAKETMNVRALARFLPLSEMRLFVSALGAVKNILLLGFFAALLIAGFLMFQKERVQTNQQAQDAMRRVEALKNQSDSALQRKDENNANRFLQEAWSIVLPFTQTGSPNRKEFLFAQQDLESKLVPLNKIERVESPEAFFVIDQSQITLIPQRMMANPNTMYLYNPFYSQLYVIDMAKKEGKLLQSGRNLKRGALIDGSPAFFAEPNLLLQLTPEEQWKEVALAVPSSAFQFDAMAGFGSHAYFADSKAGQIVQYTGALSGESFPIFWIDPSSSKNALGAKSIAIDGNIWTLTRQNEIQRYFKGVYQESVKPAVFPALENPSHIKTASFLPYLYVLDPPNQRLVVLSKFGDLILQYQSASFDNLLDFTVSDDGKTIYLLNGFTVYKIINSQR